MKAWRWFLPAISLVVVLFLTWRDWGGVRAGPGPLHPVHARAIAAQGLDACEACHVAGAGLDAEACARCHEPIGDQLARGVGVHGRLPAELRAKCESCHSDHHGETVALLPPHAFERAGVDLEAYDHRHVDFHLAGAHAAPQCVRCHPRAGDLEPPAGGRFLGLSQRCTSCHEDRHDGAYGSDCAQCHGQEQSWSAVPGFRHEALPLDGAHGGIACARCHEEGSDRAVAALRRQPQPVRVCRDCHADPHGRDPAAEAAVRLANTGDCRRCHDATAWADARPTPARHAGFGFALRGAHVATDCVACHGRGADGPRWPESGEPPAPEACAGCHLDVHGGGGAAPTALRLTHTDDCRRCHEPTAWSAARPTAAGHAAHGFALQGAHTTTACGACHGDAEHPARWAGPAPVAAACGACHQHPHAEPLLAAARSDAEPDGCARCHSDAATDFRTDGMPASLHAATGFPLQPPHADVACARCHHGDRRQDRFPGRAAADCRACHRDVHAGQFDREPRYPQCTDCHRTTSFRPTAFGLAAHADTAWPLTGAHDAVACGSCHGVGEDGVRRFRGTPQECRACHRDVHGGAFDRGGMPSTVAGRRGCARCHDTAAFAPVVTEFDHAVWAGWPLVDAHRRVDCAGCHARDAGVPGRRLGQAAGTRCADCHADPHAGQFAADGTTDCRRCHDSAAFAIPDFDHRRTAFALDETHARLACASCHVRYATARGGVVRYKPLGTACGDCHQLGRPQGGGR